MEERRIVTVLFCDIVGSTALASEVDAEDWSEVVRVVFPLMIDPIERHDGTVARLMGDAVLAFFGAPTAREDDPQRAILAALDIQSGIADHRERLHAEYGFDIDVRVGINTGIVVTGEFGSHAAREYTALGDTVNIAARMEQTAEPGTIQVTSETYRLALRYFEFQPLGVIEAKGKAEGVEAYRVLKRMSGLGRQRGLQDFAAPVVGRDRELDLLRYRLRELDAGHGGVIAIVAETGLGKSRLLGELRSGWRADPEHQEGSWIEDQLVSFEETTPYGLVHRRLARDLDTRDDVSRSVIEDRLGWALSDLDPRERDRATQAVSRLLKTGGDPEGSPANGAGMGAVADFRKELALVFEHIWHARVERVGRCVYVIEDFHWVDSSSAELLEQLVPELLKLSMLFILTFRPDREAPSWTVHERLSASLGVDCLSLTLAPLAGRSSDALIDALLPDVDLPHSLRQMILERIDGNPLFAEEMVRSLIEHGFVKLGSESGEPKWTVSDDVDLSTIEIPTTLQALVQERVDMLDGGTKRTLQLASVIGRRFNYDELLEVIGDPATLDDHLEALQLATLIHPDTYAGPESYVFHHALIWEAIYRSMLRRTLQRLHLQIGEALERLHVGVRDEHAGLLAQHFALARDARAVTYAETAGVRAQSLYAPLEAIEHFSRALKAADDLGQTPPARLLRQRGRAHETLGRLDAARRDFDVALELARAGGDLREEWETLVDVGRSWEGVDYHQAGNWFEQALELARRLDDPVALGHSLNRVGNWCMNTERIDEARDAHLEALAIFEDLDDEAGLAATIDYLGVTALTAGDPVEMRVRYERVVDIFERRRDLQALSSTRASMTILSGSWVFDTISSASVSSYEGAEACGLRAEQLAREIGWRSGEAYAMLNLGGLYAIAGRYDEAFEHLHEAIEISREIAHREWLASSLAMLGCLLQDILALDQAADMLEESTELVRETGSLHFIHFNTGLFVDVLLDLGQIDRASELLNELVNDLPMKTVGQRRIWTAHASWSFATGDYATALTTLDRLLETGLSVTSQEDIPLIAWRRGRALIQLGRTDDAFEALEAARRGATHLDRPARLWKIQLDLACLYHSLGRDDEASEAVLAARGIVQQIAPRIPDDDLRQNFLASSGALFDAVM